ncbi:MAG TPA: tetratricopeptide repeat protein [Gemmatimonadales bacterium]|nr:tetratricopeptide repeat protein [Gemmatimonadales bacterium]
MTRRHLRRWPPVAERARVAAQLLAEAAAFTEDVGLLTGPLALAPAGGMPKARVPVPVTVVAPPPAPEPPPAPAAAPEPPAPTPVASTPVPAAMALAETGVTLARRGLWSQAVPQFRHAIELDPVNVPIWCRLGEALNHIDDLDGARLAYEKGLAVDEKHPRALYGMGVVLDRLRRPDEATVYYRRAREATAR